MITIFWFLAQLSLTPPPQNAIQKCLCVSTNINKTSARMIWQHCCTLLSYTVHITQSTLALILNILNYKLFDERYNRPFRNFIFTKKICFIGPDGYGSSILHSSWQNHLIIGYQNSRILNSNNLLFKTSHFFGLI